VTPLRAETAAAPGSSHHTAGTSDTAILAHGVGGRQDLPLPLEWAILGAIAALVVSFVALAVLARPRTDERRREIPVPALGRVVDSAPWRIGLRVVGLLLFAYVAMVALWGRDLDTNPIFRIVYVWWWVGIVPFSLLFGPVWRAISPVRTAHQLLARVRGSDEPLLRYPERIGYWPAAAGLLAFTWLELVYPDNAYLGPVRMWLAVYVAVMLLGSQLFGARFLERADPFEVYSTFVAKLSVWGRDEQDRLVLRSPLGNLDTLRPAPGLVAVVMVLFGTIGYDSYHEAPSGTAVPITWSDVVDKVEVATGAGDLTYLMGHVGLIGFPLVLGVLFCLGTMATGVGDVARRRLPALLAPSMIPVIAGYIVAHYLSFFWEQGLVALRDASDPFGTGADWFGTAGIENSFFFATHGTLLAVIKVAAVIVGHVLGVWSAHIRAVQVIPQQHLITGQVPLFLTMVFFTGAGLYLLFAT